MKNAESKTSDIETGLSTNLSIIKGAYYATANGDFPAFLNAMDPIIEWNEAENFPYSDGNPYIGPDAIVQGVFARIGADWEYWTISDQVYHVTQDEMVIVTGRYNAKHKVTGKIIRVQFTHMWTLKNNKIIRFQQYADTLQVNQAFFS
jgi:uncharacterized protein